MNDLLNASTAGLPIEPMPPSRLFLSLEGRLRRRDYWQRGVLPLLLVLVVGTALLNIAGLPLERAEGLMNLVLAWPMLAVSVKRWHDRNRSGWWMAVLLVPVVGWLWLLIDNGCLRGDAGPNDYGPPPA
ncbi:DUF805 domain-containing protein [Ideonella livida]|uniref:DUF805 domain-containing protein n=1 Tax=Ideonella livida TaxID=2707176 RepID=A0A7C9TGK8_9BURK|nr:DUF805 domain-containing protein [Ideonella livida]NDY89839.1 DUF805 domain-containing protein [Ideonella livida]